MGDEGFEFFFYDVFFGVGVYLSSFSMVKSLVVLLFDIFSRCFLFVGLLGGGWFCVFLLVFGECCVGWFVVVSVWCLM